ncbi:SMC family ATPase [Kibdelosporangium philippinense]|uniref:Nuclease SbcCD subunit C n=1 Tax=Kibdelosporangium philippinense TaxID=211113 RepID=A0ABS8ZVP4_9PSEU|nr:SMC family ATPase [Kibdelosporangium philippinense]MCE7011776.1 SMC family ATPase [Kibdelosporangium philippinense]
MRPLTLKFRGLRSYRAEQEIDFRNVSLMAIVGDTGAGKSSLLEALCFALYGGCTWDARSGKGLIADGGDGTLRVELTFQAKGKTWRVTRTTSASGYPPSTHRLTCLDDGTEVDNSRAVDSAIRGLVGLDYTAFLKAVVLPQGRFQELLQTPEANRTAILKTALRLDHITDVRNQAKALYERLNPLLTKLVVRRAGLLPDPEEALRDALHRLSETKAENGRLETVKTAVTEAQKTHDDAARRGQECRSAARQLTTRIPPDTEHRYQQLIEFDAALKHQLSTIEGELSDAEAREEELGAVLDGADADGTGVAAVASTLATLKSLLDQLPAIEEDQRQLDSEDAAIQAERADLQARKDAHVEIVREAEQAQTHADEMDAAHAAAANALGRYRVLLTDARNASTAVDTATVEVEKARQAAREHEEAVDKATNASSQADTEAEAAEEQVEAASRTNAAAHAAEHSGPGDPCPVCVRPLPDGFAPPAVADVARVKALRTRANKRARALADELAAAVESNNTAKATLQGALGKVSEAISQRDTALELVHAELGKVDFGQDDETLLTDAQFTARQAADAKQTAVDAAKVAQDAATRDITEIRRDEAALIKREKALAKSRSALKRRQGKMAESHDTLPTAYQISGDLNTAAIQRAMDQAQRRQGELAEVTTQLKSAQAQAKRLRDNKNGVIKDIQSRVEQPAEQLSRTIQAVADTAAAIPWLSEPPAIPARPEPFSILTDAQWGKETLNRVDEIIRLSRDAASAQDDVAAGAATAITEALSRAGVATIDELTELFIAAKAKAKVAERDRDKAQADLPICAELDRRISVAQPTVDSLRELSSLLADGKFLAAVVKRRQRALLGIASELFLSMTEDRFAFSDDFRIVDGHTGQPRDVKTLSGGETFLASLALALALVELTSRGGGRVEALFLDEGFGSLDTNVLGEALEALTRQAMGGRLVAVISHMRAVAENFDNVLMVTRTLSGSEAHWASPAERDQLVTDELAAGLLT